MTLKRAQQNDTRDELFLEVGRPYVSTPPEEEDGLDFDPGDEWREDEDVRMKDATALSYVRTSLAEFRTQIGSSYIHQKQRCGNCHHGSDWSREKYVYLPIDERRD